MHTFERSLFLQQNLVKFSRYPPTDITGACLWFDWYSQDLSILEPQNGLKLLSVGWDTKYRLLNLINNGKSNIAKVKNGGKWNVLKPDWMIESCCLQ